MKSRGAVMRYENLIMFQDTMSILESGYYVVGTERKKLKLTRTQMEASEVYLPEDVQEITERKNFEHQHELGRCEYGCENIDSFSLARKRMKNHFHELREEESKPILVLNLANPFHPGGGVKNGAKAQEEVLCRKSSLLLSLESRNSEAYYKYNRFL